MKKHRIIWAILGLIFYIATKYYAPFSWITNIPFCLFSAVICGLFLFLTLGNISSFKDLVTKSNTVLGKICIYISIPITVYLFTTLITSEDNVSKLRKHGVITEAIILDGKSMISNGGVSYYLDLSFKSNSGREHIIEKKVGMMEFESSTKGKIIHIVYLPTNINISRIITTKKDLSYYSNIKTNHINYNHIKKIILIEDLNTRLDILNKHSFGWHISHDYDIPYLNNNFTEEILISNKKGNLVYKNEFNLTIIIPQNEILSKKTTENATIYATKTINIVVTDHSEFQFSLIEQN